MHFHSFRSDSPPRVGLKMKRICISYARHYRGRARDAALSLLFTVGMFSFDDGNGKSRVQTPAGGTREGSGFSNQSMHVYAPANDYIIQQQCAKPRSTPPRRTLHLQSDSRRFRGRNARARARGIHLVIDLAARTFKCE